MFRTPLSPLRSREQLNNSDGLIFVWPDCKWTEYDQSVGRLQPCHASCLFGQRQHRTKGKDERHCLLSFRLKESDSSESVSLCFPGKKRIEIRPWRFVGSACHMCSATGIGPLLCL